MNVRRDPKRVEGMRGDGVQEQGERGQTGEERVTNMAVFPFVDAWGHFKLLFIHSC